METNSIDLTRGADKFNERINNAKGIINNVKLLFSDDEINISDYENELQSIISLASNDQKLDNNNAFAKMGYSNMQMDYEGFSYTKYTEQVDALIKKMNSELDPLIKFKTAIKKLDSELSHVSANNIDSIINLAKELITLLNGVQTHNDKSLSKIKEEAYKYLYEVLLEEEVYEKEDLLVYIKYINVQYINENIGRLIEKDINSDERLKSIISEGLDYDYLDGKIINSVAESTKQQEIRQYIARKKFEKEEENYRLQEQKKVIEDQNKTKELLTKVKIKKRKAIAKLFSIFLVPVITISAGGAIGKKASENVLEYETITATYDLDTGEQVGESQIVYDENETTYVASIEEYSPWSKKDTGKDGYIRTVRVYEYKPQNEEEELTIEDIHNNARLKYTYTETKKELNDEDKTKDITVLVTETTQDKTNTKPSKKFILPGLLIGLGIATLIDLVLIFYYEVLDERFNLSKYNDEENEYKVSLKEAQSALELLQKESNTYYIDSDKINHYTRLINK